jgi:hypothetical protein
MGGFWLLASTMLVVTVPAVAADQGAWSPTVDGLKMSIVITGDHAADPDAELQITLKNTSHEPILVQLGQILNQRMTVLSFQAFVTTPDGSERKVILGPARIFGSLAINPLAIELIGNASYTVSAPLSEWKDWSSPTDLKALLSKPSQVRVELDMTKTECSGGRAPNTVRACWRGKLVSNVLRLK